MIIGYLHLQKSSYWTCNNPSKWKLHWNSFFFVGWLVLWSSHTYTYAYASTCKYYSIFGCHQCTILKTNLLGCKTFFFRNIKHYWHLRHIFVLRSERVIIPLNWRINVCPLNWEWVGCANTPWSSMYASQCLSRPTTVWTDERPAVSRMC